MLDGARYEVGENNDGTNRRDIIDTTNGDAAVLLEEPRRISGNGGIESSRKRFAAARTKWPASSSPETTRFA